jgi:hypothetical protein
MKTDFLNNNAVELVVSAEVLSADADGDSVDLQGFDSVTFVAVVGVGGITFTGVNKITLEVEHSDDDSTFADCVAADTLGEDSAGVFGSLISAAVDDAVFTVQYVGNKRYVRPVVNFAGTHGTGTPISIVAIKHGPQYRPVS